MRTLAKDCGTALGTLYNYYSDKDELVIAAIESVWRDILGESEPESEISFTEYVAGIYERIHKGLSSYPDFFAAHSIAVAGSAKGRAKGTMERCFGQIREELLKALDSDRNIHHSTFTEAFTEENLVEHILDSITMLIIKGKPDCAVLTEMLDRILYS